MVELLMMELLMMEMLMVELLMVELLMLKLPLLENAVAGVAVAAKAAAVAVNCRCTIAASVTVVAVGAAVLAVVTLAVYAVLKFLSENLILSYLLLLSMMCRWSVVVDVVVVDELVLQTVCEIRRKKSKIGEEKDVLIRGHALVSEFTHLR